MSLQRILLLTPILCLLFSCTSINEAGRAYFIRHDKIHGVESPDAIHDRLTKDRRLMEIMHGQIKAAEIVQCTILRNQLYVAQLKGASGADGKRLKLAAIQMEEAYQQDDASFLSACRNIRTSPIGKILMGIQQEYFSHTR